jgi:hypothetical protein
VQHALQVPQGHIEGRIGGRHWRRPPFDIAPTSGPRLGARGDSVCNLVQPAANCLSPSNGIRLARQHQKRGLERVLGVLLVPEDAAANALNHGRVSPYQRGEGGFITLPGKTLQQLGIRRLGWNARRTQPPNLLKNGARLCAGHYCGSGEIPAVVD